MSNSARSWLARRWIGLSSVLQLTLTRRASEESLYFTPSLARRVSVERFVKQSLTWVVMGLLGCGQSQNRTTVNSGQATPARTASSDTPVSDATPPNAPPPVKTPEWTSLFDGVTLGNWQSTQFGGEGDVAVEDGMIMLPVGDDMTGITWKGPPPARMNYEIEVEARRVDGYDFFCGLTFPVGTDSCSLICGGWGGEVTGLSSLDGNDASRNETTRMISYERGRWYRIRARVTQNRIEAWLDDDPIIDADTTNRKIGIRGEVEPSKPLGIATWRTKGAIRAIRWRKIETEPSEAPR